MELRENLNLPKTIHSRQGCDGMSYEKEPVLTLIRLKNGKWKDPISGIIITDRWMRNMLMGFCVNSGCRVETKESSSGDGTVKVYRPLQEFWRTL